MDIKDLLTATSQLKRSYEYMTDRNNTNIFSLLHNEHEEVKLHSRFISYLLSPSSSHKMGDAFLQEFFKVLEIHDTTYSVNSSYKVIPSEKDKREYKEIDLLIVNKKKQAIIIENKINASASNYTNKKEGYNGQLERYYNTIVTGKDVNDRYDSTYHCNEALVFYLSMHNSKLTQESIGNAPNVKEISYGIHIRAWLNSCINVIPSTNHALLYTIKQYLNLINKMTYNEIEQDEKLELKKCVAEELEGTRYLINNFKHVKWHTAHEFWTKLRDDLQNTFQNVKFYPENFEDAISLTTHSSKVINHGVLFDYNDTPYYIAGEGILSWGVIEDPKTTHYCFNDDQLATINFSDFQSTSTFDLINTSKMHESVKLILQEVIDKLKSGM